MSALAPGVRVHVVGVGGAGMSGLALLLAEMGAVVSGSDVADTPVLAELRAHGVTTSVGHDATQVVGAEVVVWSPAVPEDDAELVAARGAGLRMLSRAEALGELSAARRVVGFAGTHGKTTVTSMMVQVALAAGRDDGWLVGAPVLGVGANGHWGDGDLIVEVDESYGTFAQVRPFALGLTNVEPDHLDHYGTTKALEDAFVELVERTTGPVVAWGGDAGATRVAAARHDATIVGRDGAFAWRVRDEVLARRGSSFVLDGPDESLALSLRVTGAHNIANAALVAVVARRLGVDADAVVRGLSNFLGAPRRFQYRGAWRGVDVYEDYAHLPGEIAATIATARDLGYESVTVVFQPHRVTRTRSLLGDFATAFAGARHLVVTDLYTAGEANPDGLSGEVVAAAVRSADASVDVTYCASWHEAPKVLEDLLDVSDVVLVLGAGDVGGLVAELPGGLA